MPETQSHKIQKTSLANGVVIATEEVASAYSCSLGIWIDVGSRDEPLEQNGIAHLFEHMVFKGSEKYSGYEIVRKLESGGGQVNAFTTKEQTCFYAKVLGQKAMESLGILLNMVFKPSFSELELAKERDVIIEELRGTEDSPEEYVYDIFGESLYGKSGMGLPIAGTVASVKKLNKTHLLDHLERVRHCFPVYIIASGKINHCDVCRVVEASLQHMPLSAIKKSSNAIRQIDRSLRPVFNQNHALVHKDVQQVNVILGGKGMGIEEPDSIAVMILNEVLGDGMSSRLFQKLREEFGFVYHINSFTEFHQNNGLFGVSFSTDGAQFQRVIDEICSEFRALLDNGISKEELQFAKDNIIGNFLMDMESVQSRMVFLSRLLMRGDIFNTHDKYLEAVKNIRMEDISRVIHKIFDSSYWSTASVVPVGFDLPKNFVLDF